MGRRKIDITLIVDEKNRRNTFEKRRKGIEKKVKELAALSGSDILFLVLPHQTNAPPSAFVAGTRSSSEWSLLVEEYTQFQDGQLPFHANPPRKPGRPSKHMKTEAKLEVPIQHQIQQSTPRQTFVEPEKIFISKPIQVSPRHLRICPKIL